MTLEEFAREAGVKVVPSMDDEGGFDYQEEDAPNTTITGFGSIAAAYSFWLTETFGNRTAGVIRKLLKEEGK